MNLKKGTPGRGGGARADSFSYCPVAHGLKNSFSAWLAGEPYWCDEAHEHTDRDPGTKPCLHWMTDGALSCPRCRQARPVKCIGWVPLYREQDARPVIVIVHESASDLLAGLHYPDFVIVGRVDKKDSVFVRRSDNRVSLTTNVESRKRPVNIACNLLMMWRMPELNEWLSRAGRWSGVPGDEHPAIRQRLSVPAPTTETESLAIDAERRAGSAAGVFGGTADEVIKRIHRRVSSNGKHDGAPEGGAK